MGRPKIEESLSNSQPNWPIGGAIATTDAKRLVTPKPLVVDSNVLYPCNPGLNQNKMAISDFISAETFLPAILKYVQNLLLRTSPRFFAQSEPNHCRNVLWRVNINNYRKKVEILTHVFKGA